MKFYSSIAKAYDSIFPLNTDTENFVVNCLEGDVGNKHIIDAGCATGSLAISLARKSAMVRGFDIDADMIAMANDKRPQALNLQFDKGNLLNFDNNYKAGSFDMLTCFGNTLAHLSTLEELEQFILATSKVLLPYNSSVAIQIINFDKVLSKNIKRLPLIDTPEYSFKRFYKHIDASRIEFLTTLTVKETGEEIKNSQMLMPIKVEILMDILAKHFPFVEAWGGFNFDIWSENTHHTIVVASR